jgi:hypothetical protein
VKRGIAGKSFIILIVIAIVLVSAIGCGPNRQLVVGEDATGGFHTIWEASIGQEVIIEGSAFTYGDTVFVSICAALWEKAEANICGAFKIDTTIPSWAPPGPVSVEAWIDDGDDIFEYDDDDQQASWPLNISEPCQCGEWGSIIVSTETWQDTVECGDSVHTPADVGAVQISANYLCEPQQECQATYEWELLGSLGINGACNSSPCVFELELTGECIDVSISAYCDDTLCDDCTFTICPCQTMVVASNVSNTEFCDGTPAVAITNPDLISAAWTDELEIECGAQWLWDNANGAIGSQYPHDDYGSDLLCTTFDIPTGYEVVSAELKISADDEATSIELNGNYIGSHSGFGSESGSDSVSTINIAPNLFTETNTLEVEVTDTHRHYQGGTWCLFLVICTESG